jgi:threonine dehydrogenase-like Zn-dependent dehydrogenase
MIPSARAFWTVAAGQGEIRAAPLDRPGDGRALIRTIATGVSRGTEALVFAGRVPPSQHVAMRAPLMAGAFPFPVKYGYSAVGRHEPDGARVFVLHPHQDVFTAPASMCMPIPDTVPTLRALLAANMETALNILWDAAPQPGERALVIGAGVVGLLVASLLARIPALAVTVADTDPRRAGIARSLSCQFVLPDAGLADFDLVIHSSGTAAGLRAALGAARFEGRIVEASWFGDVAPEVPLGEAFHSRRLRLIASQVGAVAPAMRGRLDHRQRLGIALGLLANPAYDALLEGPTPFEELPRAMPRILAPGGLCHVVTYGADACTA